MEEIEIQKQRVDTNDLLYDKFDSDQENINKDNKVKNIDIECVSSIKDLVRGVENIPLPNSGSKTDAPVLTESLGPQ